MKKKTLNILLIRKLEEKVVAVIFFTYFFVLFLGEIDTA